MASDAYQDHGLIVLWWDESEGGDDPSRTLPFIIISGDAHKNVNGVPYSNTIQVLSAHHAGNLQRQSSALPMAWWRHNRKRSVGFVQPGRDQVTV